LPVLSLGHGGLDNLGGKASAETLSKT
jgi:hypothetical protein